MEGRFNNPAVYAVWHPDDAVRISSSSGGAFSLLAEAVIGRGGVVFGAVWNGQMQVVMDYVETVDGLAKLRESKYVAAIPGDEYKKARMFLESGREVLFSGTPCQIAGLYSFLGKKEFQNLITVDFICHGAPDRRVWEKFVDYIEEKYEDRIHDVHFRDKRWGVECNLLLRIGFSRSRHDKIIAARGNTYYYGFVHNMFMRKCCMNCHFNQVPRKADFSLADFRGLGEHVPFQYECDKVKGFTGVMVNSSRARMFLARLDLRTWISRPFSELADSQSMLRESPKPHWLYEKFWNDFELESWNVLEEKYLRPSLKYIAYILLRRFLGARLFLRLGIVYKKIRGIRTTSWWPKGYFTE